MSGVRVLLQPRVGGAASIRAWVGVLGHAGTLADADLTWTVDGNAVAARAIRHLDRTFAHAGTGFVGTQTGVFELPSGAGPHEVRVTAALGGTNVASDPLRTSPVPAALPADGRSTFNVLIASCYYEPKDKGRVGHGIANLPAPLKPHLTLLMGDQVYLDNPPTETFAGGRPGVTKRLEQKYLANWVPDPARTGGYAPAVVGADRMRPRRPRVLEQLPDGARVPRRARAEPGQPRQLDPEREGPVRRVPARRPRWP